jgi:hypothetical protein
MAPLLTLLNGSKGEVTECGATVRAVPNSRNIEPVSAIANQVSVKKIGYKKFGSGD